MIKGFHCAILGLKGSTQVTGVWTGSGFLERNSKTLKKILKLLFALTNTAANIHSMTCSFITMILIITQLFHLHLSSSSSHLFLQRTDLWVGGMRPKTTSWVNMRTNTESNALSYLNEMPPARSPEFLTTQFEIRWIWTVLNMNFNWEEFLQQANEFGVYCA